MRLITYIGPGRAGTTFIQKAYQIKYNVDKGKYILPRVKETYLLNNVVDDDLMKHFYRDKGNLYIDFSNNQYMNPDGIIRGLDYFEQIVVVLSYRELTSWLRSLLIFEVRKGRLPNQAMLEDKLKELDLRSHDISKLFSIPGLQVELFDFTWLMNQDFDSIDSHFNAVLGESLEFDFRKVNESLEPKVPVVGRLFKWLAKFMRKKKLYELLESLKHSSLWKLFYKKVDKKTINLIDDLIRNNKKLIEIVRIENELLLNRSK
jgi:hypothetical protein